MSRPYRFVAVETHPIQYKAPLFRRLAADPRFDLTVLYAMIPDPQRQGDGFGLSFSWDVPLLDGYAHEVLTNRSRHPSVTRFSGCDTPGLISRLAELRPDAVMVNGWVVKTCLQALWACRRLGLPCLVRCEANRLRPRARWKEMGHRLLLKQYQGFLAIGSANRSFYRFHGVPEDRIFFVPYTVDNQWFHEQAEARAGRRTALRERWGLPDSATVFLFAGKLETKKHPADVLRALAMVPQDLRPRAHVLVVGEGPLRRECESLATQLDINATFAGFLNQSVMPDAYAVADVLVLPSDAGETWGLVVNEAMASGLPAMVSNEVGCAEDLVREGETGRIWRRSDLTALALGMGHYLQNPDEARRQGLAASRHIQSYGLDRAVEGLHQALTQITGKLNG